MDSLNGLVRAAGESDSKAIQDLSAHLGYAPYSAAQSVSWISDILHSDSDRLWVFVDNSKICGWIHALLALRVASPSYVEIAGLVVLPDARRRGIGARLVAEATGWAQSKNVKIRVRCNATRAEAHEFYENTGFLKVKTQYVFEKS